MRATIKKILSAIGALQFARRIAAHVGLVRPHGHDLLLRIMRSDRRSGRAKKNALVIEIGTREELPGQGSTATLAAYCAKAGLRFITVDMDPSNTARAKETLKRHDPDFQAINAKGEEYLQRLDRTIHYCYLDAFDIEHGQHSQERRAKYRKYLGVEIDNDLCAKMHLDCAVALVEKLDDDGVIVFDDCWEDANGWQGKGKAAVPYLLQHGFYVVKRSSNTVALRREGGSQT